MIATTARPFARRVEEKQKLKQQLDFDFERSSFADLLARRRRRNANILPVKSSAAFAAATAATGSPVVGGSRCLISFLPSARRAFPAVPHATAALRDETSGVTSGSVFLSPHVRSGLTVVAYIFVCIVNHHRPKPAQSAALKRIRDLTTTRLIYLL